jgi:hypothetical protein
MKLHGTSSQRQCEGSVVRKLCDYCPRTPHIFFGFLMFFVFSNFLCLSYWGPTPKPTGSGPSVLENPPPKSPGGCRFSKKRRCSAGWLSVLIFNAISALSSPVFHAFFSWPGSDFLCVFSSRCRFRLLMPPPLPGLCAQVERKYLCRCARSGAGVFSSHVIFTGLSRTRHCWRYLGS